MKWSASAGVAGILLIGAAHASAGVITMNADARGWIFAAGFSNGRAPDNNTFTGWGPDTGDVNSWFGFDLSTVEGRVVAAEILLDVADYESPDPSETFVLRHVSTPPFQLGTVDSVVHFDDLMTGPVFGSKAFTAGDPGHVRAIALNAMGVADVDAAVGGFWEVGGHLASLSRAGPYEAIFWAALGDPSTTRLRITTVPAPGSSMLIGLGLGLALARRRRPR